MVLDFPKSLFFGFFQVSDAAHRTGIQFFRPQCVSKKEALRYGWNHSRRTVSQQVRRRKKLTAKHKKPHEDVTSAMGRKEYETELRSLQAELCKLQEWVKYKGLRVMVVMEGRDGAGKGGTIRAITERVSPRVFRVMALPAPSDREKTQMYMQRYIPYFPAAGEVVIFDRSWYNRAGVEYVMGFCSSAQHRRCASTLPRGGTLDHRKAESYSLKYWLEVSNEEQERRFQARIEDPLRQWKLSVMDLPSRTRWYDYSRARHHAGGDRLGADALAHPALGRQEAGAPELHLASSEHDPLRGRSSQKSRDAQAIESRQL